MTPRHDWYLSEWLSTRGKRQAEVSRDLGWNKAKVSLLVSCKQQYTRDDVNALADYLDLLPHELLMHPEDAMRMRRFRDDIARLAAAAILPRNAGETKKVSAG